MLNRGGGGRTTHVAMAQIRSSPRSPSALPCPEPNSCAGAYWLRMKTPRAGPHSALPHGPLNVRRAVLPVETFVVGDRVTHGEYGLGAVVGVEETIAVLVDLAGEHVRVTTPYAELSKI